MTDSKRDAESNAGKEGGFKFDLEEGSREEGGKAVLAGTEAGSEKNRQ